MTDDTETGRRLAEWYAQPRVGLKGLAARYLDDHDPLTVRASEYFGVPYNKVTPAMRRTVHQRGSEVYGR